MSDGVQLSTDIYLPQVAGRWPVLLLRTPYGKRRFYGLPPALARRGYAVAVQDVRGRNASGGDYGFAAGEGKDTGNTVEWIRAQSWCNGQIGLIGPSYSGWCGFGVDELIDAYVLISAPMNWYNVIYPGGILQLHWALPWTRALQDNTPYAHDWTKRFRDWTRNDLQPELLQTWLEHPGPDDYWHERQFDPGKSSLQGPVLLVGGLYDFLLGETLQTWADLETTGVKRMTIGPWSHHTLLNSSPGLLDVDFGQDSAIDLAGMLDQWFSVHLKRSNTITGRSVCMFATGGGGWNQLDTWPPPGHGDEMGLQFDCVSASDPGQSGDVALFYDPQDPPPTVGGRCWPMAEVPGLDPGPARQESLCGRRDVALFLTEPLDQPATCMGEGEVEIEAEASSGVFLVVDLVDKGPSTGTRIVADSWPVKLEAGHSIRLKFSFGAIGHRFGKGHAVGLQVRCGSFPRYERTLNASRVFVSVKQHRLPVFDTTPV